MAVSPYWELAVAAPDAIADALVNFLWEHRALGVVEAPAGPDHTWLRAFFPPDVEVPRLEADVRGYLHGLEALGFAADAVPELSPLADENWGEAWREHFRPFRVGRRLIVVPPWDRDAGRRGRTGRIAVIIEPGRAFGTGHHGSTASCLERLETVARPSVIRAIDVGTGSGILAVAALRLGVPRVLAVDEDPDAVTAARENARRNGVAARMRCRVADAAQLRATPAPLVLANLLAAAHERLAPCYPGLVAPGGRLLLGGILGREARSVASAVEAHGFRVVGSTRNDGWACLELRRAASARVARR
jgi:ribosomal protein L11 methyltransferase